MLTKTVECPLCEQSFELDINPEEAEQDDAECPECLEDLGVEFDKATGEVTLVELIEADEDEEGTCLLCGEFVDDCVCEDLEE